MVTGMIVCQMCQANMEDDSRFCYNCGSLLDGAAATTSPDEQPQLQPLHAYQQEYPQQYTQQYAQQDYAQQYTQQAYSQQYAQYDYSQQPQQGYATPPPPQSGLTPQKTSAKKTKQSQIKEKLEAKREKKREALKTVTTDFTILQGLCATEYKHPLDNKTLETLKNVPFFQKMLKLIQEPFNTIDRAKVLGSCLQVCEISHPSVYRMMREACVILGVDEPDLYLYNSKSGPAVLTAFHEEPVIRISACMLDIMDEKELMFIFGHELAHIMSGHLVYNMIGTVLEEGTLKTLLDMIPGIGIISDATVIALVYAYFEWSRTAEYTCDRAGFLTCQDKDAACRALMKIAGYSYKYVDERSLESFIEQGREFEGIDSKDFNKVQKVMLSFGASNPWTVCRVSELLRFEESGLYTDILERKTFIPGGVDEYNAPASTAPVQKTSIKDKTGKAFGKIGKKADDMISKL